MAHTIKIAKREFPLAFTLGTMELLEAQVKDFDLQKIDEIVRSAKGLLDVLYCLMQEGAILETGKDLDVDRRWLGAHCKPSADEIGKIHEAVVDAMVAGMSMESDEEDPDREVDVTLEQLKKNGTKES